MPALVSDVVTRIVAVILDERPHGCGGIASAQMVRTWIWSAQMRAGRGLLAAVPCSRRWMLRSSQPVPRGTAVIGRTSLHSRNTPGARLRSPCRSIRPARSPRRNQHRAALATSRNPLSGLHHLLHLNDGHQMRRQESHPSIFFRAHTAGHFSSVANEYPSYHFVVAAAC